MLLILSVLFGFVLTFFFHFIFYVRKLNHEQIRKRRRNVTIKIKQGIADWLVMIRDMK